MNYKRKSRRRLFLLMRSRTPPISSEFRGVGVGGLNTPNPPSRYATVTDHRSVFLPSVTQYAMRMRHIVIQHVRPYSFSPHYLINYIIFGKKLLNTECVFGLSLQFLFETFLILWTNGQDTPRCEVPFILVRL